MPTTCDAGANQMLGSWLTFIPAIITAAVGLAGLLGLAKYLIEP
jgi:hypothetical protein